MNSVFKTHYHSKLEYINETTQDLQWFSLIDLRPLYRVEFLLIIRLSNDNDYELQESKHSRNPLKNTQNRVSILIDYKSLLSSQFEFSLSRSQVIQELCYLQSSSHAPALMFLQFDSSDVLYLRILQYKLFSIT